MRLKLLLTAAAALGVLFTGRAGAADPVDMIAKIKEAGTLQVCMAEGPVAIRNPATGEWSGYNPDMAKDLAATLGVKLELVVQPYATIIPALMSGKCDIAMAPLYASSERAEIVAFTDHYSTIADQVLVAENSSYKTWEDLNNPNVTIAEAAGTTQEAYVRTAFPKAKLRSIVSDNTYAFILEVAAGRADAAFTDHDSATNLIAKNPQMKLRVLQPERTANDTGRAYAVRPDDWHFVNFLNIWLYNSKNKYKLLQ
jgi:ABC-type amino acid transport substrate-binding protein